MRRQLEDMFRSLHLVHDEIGVDSAAARSEGQPEIANVLSLGVCNRLSDHQSSWFVLTWKTAVRSHLKTPWEAAVSRTSRALTITTLVSTERLRDELEHFGRKNLQCTVESVHYGHNFPSESTHFSAAAVSAQQPDGQVRGTTFKGSEVIHGTRRHDLRI
jgi:hypothetical protein